MQMWHPAQLLLIMCLISLIDFLLLLWHLMTNCTRLHPPGRDSPILRDPAAFGWVCVQSHIQRGTQLPGSWISGLLIRELFSAGHPIFPSDTLCSSRIHCSPLLSGFSAQNFLKLTGLHLSPMFTLNFCLMMMPAPAFSSCRLSCCFGSAGGCTTLLTTSSLTGALFPLLLYSDQCEFQVKPSLLCHVWRLSSWWN